MLREFSAGGVVVRLMAGAWHIAVIEPRKEEAPEPATPAKPASTRRKKPARKILLALPKGLVDEGEKPQDAAVREVREETGICAIPITKLSDIKYVYVRSWGDQQKVFKIVSFYLLRYDSGTVDDVSPEMRVEVRKASWIPLAEAGRKLAYSGERQVVRRAQEYLEAHPEA